MFSQTFRIECAPTPLYPQRAYSFTKHERLKLKILYKNPTSRPPTRFVVCRLKDFNPSLKFAERFATVYAIYAFVLLIVTTTLVSPQVTEDSLSKVIP